MSKAEETLRKIKKMWAFKIPQVEDSDEKAIKEIESFAEKRAVEFVGALGELEFRDDNGEWHFMPSIDELTLLYNELINEPDSLI